MSTSSKHLDVEQLMEDFAWRFFKDIQGMRQTKNNEFKNLERDDVEFNLNMKKLRIDHSEPNYTNLHANDAKPYTLFKSVYTNNTERLQNYSFKTERTTESVATVCRDQGFSVGNEAELSLKTPGEIMEFKAGFKYEMNFHTMNDNSIIEQLTWGADSTVEVQPHFQTTASIVIEELNFQGAYVITSRLSGPVTIVIRRRKDGILVLPVTTNIVEIFKELFNGGHVTKDVKSMTTIEEEENTVKLVSKGTCSFQFAMKQKIDLSESPLNEKEMID